MCLTPFLRLSPLPSLTPVYLKRTHNSTKDFNPLWGFLWSVFPETNRGLTGTCWNKWQRQTLQASHQIRTWAHIKEMGKLWSSVDLCGAVWLTATQRQGFLGLGWLLATKCVDYCMFVRKAAPNHNMTCHERESGEMGISIYKLHVPLDICIFPWRRPEVCRATFC